MFLRNLSISFFTFVFFICSCDSKESDPIGIEVFAYPNPFIQGLIIDLITDSDVPVRIYLYNRSYQEINLTELNEGRTITRNPIVDETISSNEENTYSFDFGEMDPGIYLMDIVVNGKAKRITLYKVE